MSLVAVIFFELDHEFRCWQVNITGSMLNSHVVLIWFVLMFLW
ncbi:Uncharacterised protein [Vibrio cincinnatiensis]|nr:Uncharacterised protein [Vibrio cincinnatiensis]SUP05677.1 Uncharacterised protein [Vibrio cincinnatiensis]SUP05702.1 Uncharacterised protein [Vibrio cincinnatiensis]